MGNASEIITFKRMMGGYPFPFYGSPNQQAYYTFGAARFNLSQMLFQPNLLARSLEVTAKGHLPGIPVGDVTQLGAEFLIDKGGIVRWRHIARDASDHTTTSTLLATFDKIFGSQQTTAKN